MASLAPSISTSLSEVVSSDEVDVSDFPFDEKVREDSLMAEHFFVTVVWVSGTSKLSVLFKEPRNSSENKKILV